MPTLQTVWWQSTDARLMMTSFKRKRFGDSQGVSILMGIMMPSSFSPPSSLLDSFFFHPCFQSDNKRRATSAFTTVPRKMG